MEGWAVDEEESCRDEGFHGGVHVPHDLGHGEDTDSFSAIARFVWCCTPSIRSAERETVQAKEFFNVCCSCQKVMSTGRFSERESSKCAEDLFKQCTPGNLHTRGLMDWPSFRTALHRLCGTYLPHGTVEQRSSWLAQTANRITTLRDHSDEIPISLLEWTRRRSTPLEQKHEAEELDPRSRGGLFRFRELCDVSPDPTFERPTPLGLFGEESAIAGSTKQDTIEDILSRAAARSKARRKSDRKDAKSGGWLRSGRQPSMPAVLPPGGPALEEAERRALEALLAQDDLGMSSASSVHSCKSTELHWEPSSEFAPLRSTPPIMGRRSAGLDAGGRGARRLHTSQCERLPSATGSSSSSSSSSRALSPPERRPPARTQLRGYKGVDLDLERTMETGRRKGSEDAHDGRWVCVFTGQVLSKPPADLLARSPARPQVDAKGTRPPACAAGPQALTAGNNLAEGLVGRPKLRVDTSYSLDRMQAKLVLRVTHSTYSPSPAEASDGVQAASRVNFSASTDAGPTCQWKGELEKKRQEMVAREQRWRKSMFAEERIKERDRRRWREAGAATALRMREPGRRSAGSCVPKAFGWDWGGGEFSGQLAS